MNQLSRMKISELGHKFIPGPELCLQCLDGEKIDMLDICQSCANENLLRHSRQEQGVAFGLFSGLIKKEGN